MPHALTLRIMQDEAKKHDGECISPWYINCRYPIMFRCKRGHVFRAKPFNVRAGCFCPECGNENKGIYLRLPLETLKDFAKANGGMLISTNYKNIMQLLTWQCSDGHIFKASAHQIRRRQRFCPKCESSHRIVISNSFNRMMKELNDEGGNAQ